VVRKIFSNKKIVILLGVAVILYVASFGAKEKEEPREKYSQVEYIDEKKLEKILSNVKGAGNVFVYISYENSGINNVAYDYRNSSEGNEVKVKTMGKSNLEEPYVLSRTNPEIAGIFVTATGAESDDMKALLKKYVKAATNVSLNKIEVAQGEK
jgi:hypothetical protein